MKLYAIRNVETGEFFKGTRGHVVWPSSSAATNAFNHYHAMSRYDETLKLQNRTDWEKVEVTLNVVGEPRSIFIVNQFDVAPYESYHDCVHGVFDSEESAKKYIEDTGKGPHRFDTDNIYSDYYISTEVEEYVVMEY